MLKKYFKKYRADLIVLWFTPENDVWNNMFPTTWPQRGSPKPTFWLKDGKLQGPTEDLLDVVYSSPKFRVFDVIKKVLY